MQNMSVIVFPGTDMLQKFILHDALAAPNLISAAVAVSADLNAEHDAQTDDEHGVQKTSTNMRWLSDLSCQVLEESKDDMNLESLVLLLKCLKIMVNATFLSQDNQIYSQCNIYEAGKKKVAFKYLTEKAGDKEEACSGCIISEGDLFVTGTQDGLLNVAAQKTTFHPSEFYTTCTVEPPTDSLKQVTSCCATINI